MILSVGIITYNHASFIRQCLDSVLMQKADFDFEIVVGDDGSVDGTQEVLKEYQGLYPNKIVLLLNDKNEGISKNYKNVLTRCRGKYVALCEGDDYWTAEDKLQKQVEFLESHKEYGFVGAYSHLLFPDGRIQEDNYEFMPKPVVEDGWELYGDVFDYAKYGPVTRTVSLCFRRSIIEPYLQYEGLGNDMVLQTVLAKHSWFAKNILPMTIYRQGGVSTDVYSFEKEIYYNDWYVGNRLLQKNLFPNDCNWDEDELLDRGAYIRIRHAVQKNDWRTAVGQKRLLRTNKYRKKIYSRLVFGPISCFLLSVMIGNQMKWKNL